MNCRAVPPLLSAERDGALTASDRTALAEHLEHCTSCRSEQNALATAMDALRTSASRIDIPDARVEWQALRTTLHQSSPPAPARHPSSRPARPLLTWLAAPLAAAAALAIAIQIAPHWLGTDTPAKPIQLSAKADFVELPANSATSMVYVDDRSGWLVVWAVDNQSVRGI